MTIKRIGGDRTRRTMHYGRGPEGAPLETNVPERVELPNGREDSLYTCIREVFVPAAIGLTFLSLVAAGGLYLCSKITGPNLYQERVNIERRACAEKEFLDQVKVYENDTHNKKVADKRFAQNSF